ncbi:hypothetical protein LTR56_021068 [Elasticomyces elasticus]|nr:hypothetical protein LTR56_021068 [Elasticomyces elasticus]KAK4911651.1 hypothetical protein LTR49_019815 [Elasticomyces elasticus]KAK5748926.1 hypothetical protein LTS12_021031 [Elasticomyces elasticus]
MEMLTSTTPTPTTEVGTTSKRKRSESAAPPSQAPPSKVAKTGSALSINYLARHTQEDLPLLNKEDTIPNLLQLLGRHMLVFAVIELQARVAAARERVFEPSLTSMQAYNNVLDRHESLASNLGARPLGPILIKRFERCFDAPPKIVATHHKGAAASGEDTGHNITWLEVIEFARSHPSQFTLSTFSEGKRVCQFYYPQKQLRVQISEEDFLFINSGRCQELIPPLPIWEDEEKEVGTCDVLETKLKELTNLADMVAARTRQLSHRLKGRRAAILERRADGGSGTPAKISAQQTTTAPPSSSSGFAAVNGVGDRVGDIDTNSGSFAAVRSELLKHFESLPQNHANPGPHSRHHSTTYPEHTALPAAKQVENAHTHYEAASTNSSLSPVPPNLPIDPVSYYGGDGTPATSRAPTTGNHRPSVSSAGQMYGTGPTPSKHNFSRPLPPALESSQPFRPLCQAHMDGLPRGHRVMPPCDRCRRLRMDCVKNLTSCSGCTKKHARCHWRDVSREELGELDHLMDSMGPAAASYGGEVPNGYTNGITAYDGADDSEDDDDDSNPLEDLEALGEKEEQREKEVADRAKEDEEGLRNARELAKQGREASTYASIDEQHAIAEMIDQAAPEATTTQLASKETSHSVIDSREQDIASMPHSAVHSHPGLSHSGDTALPTPPQSQAQTLQIATPYGGGFHAVNGATPSATWRTT